MSDARGTDRDSGGLDQTELGGIAGDRADRVGGAVHQLIAAAIQDQRVHGHRATGGLHHDARGHQLEIGRPLQRRQQAEERSLDFPGREVERGMQRADLIWQRHTHDGLGEQRVGKADRADIRAEGEPAIAHHLAADDAGRGEIIKVIADMHAIGKVGQDAREVGHGSARQGKAEAAIGPGHHLGLHHAAGRKVDRDIGQRNAVAIHRRARDDHRRGPRHHILVASTHRAASIVAGQRRRIGPADHTKAGGICRGIAWQKGQPAGAGGRRGDGRGGLDGSSGQHHRITRGL